MKRQKIHVRYRIPAHVIWGDSGLLVLQSPRKSLHQGLNPASLDGNAPTHTHKYNFFHCLKRTIDR